MWKNQTLPLFQLNQETKTHLMSQSQNPLIINSLQNLQNTSSFEHSKINQRSLVANQSHQSLVTKFDQVQQLEELQRLRLELFKGSQIMQQIKTESNKIKLKIEEIVTTNLSVSPKNASILIQSYNPRNIKNKRLKQNISIKQSHSKQQNVTHKEILFSLLKYVDSYLGEVDVLCSKYIELESVIRIQQAKYKSNQKKGMKVYNKILIACDEKLEAAESVLNQLTGRLSQKDTQIRICKQKEQQNQNTILNLQQKIQSLEKQNTLKQSDIIVYQQIIDKKTKQISTLNTNFEELTQRYDNLFIEYQRLQTKSDWLQNIYEEKRMKLGEVQTQNLLHYQQHSLEKRTMNSEFQKLTTLLKNKENQYKSMEKTMHRQLQQIKMYANSEMQILKGQTDRYKTFYEQAKQELKQLQNRYKQTRSTSQRYCIIINELKQQNKTLEQRTIQNPTQVHNLKQHIDYLQLQIQFYKKKVNQLQQNLKEVEEDMSTVLQELKMKQTLIEEQQTQIEQKYMTIKQLKKQVNQIFQGTSHFQMDSLQEQTMSRQQKVSRRIANQVIAEEDSERQQEGISYYRYPSHNDEQNPNKNQSLTLDKKVVKFNLHAFQNKHSYHNNPTHHYLQTFKNSYNL